MSESKAQADDPGGLAQLFRSAWNAHDMVAFGNLFDRDATFVSRYGHYWRGRSEIVDRHTEIHETIYRQSSITTRVMDVDRVDANSAIVHVHSLVSVGAAMQSGPREFSTHFLFIASFHNERWWIKAAVNIAHVDPMTNEMLAKP